MVGNDLVTLERKKSHQFTVISVQLISSLIKKAIEGVENKNNQHKVKQSKDQREEKI